LTIDNRADDLIALLCTEGPLDLGGLLILDRVGPAVNVELFGIPVEEVDLGFIVAVQPFPVLLLFAYGWEALDNPLFAVLVFTARPGETVRLDAIASDPDGNAVQVKWWRWKDVDTYPGDVTIASPNTFTTSLQVPSDAKAGQTIQLVLEATDNGTPPLTRYQRVVIAVVP